MKMFRADLLIKKVLELEVVKETEKMIQYKPTGFVHHTMTQRKSSELHKWFSEKDKALSWLVYHLRDSVQRNRATLIRSLNEIIEIENPCLGVDEIRKKLFLEQLHDLLERYDATIHFECHPHSDTYGLSEDHLVLRVKEEIAFESEGWHISSNDIKGETSTENNLPEELRDL